MGLTKKDKTKLINAHEKLQLIVLKASEFVDFIILETHRSAERQALLLEQGKTKVEYSKHNFLPSHAIDIAPIQPKEGRMVLDWEDHRPFYFLAGVMHCIARQENIKLRWGGDWDSDLDFKDQTFNDLVHFELLLK